MIVVMKPGATKQQVQHVIDLVREYGLKDHVIHGTDRTVVACIGDKRMVDKGAIENAPMVERIVPILAPYKMASTEVKRTRTEVAIGPKQFPIGGRRVGVVAGPCAVESREQLLRTADAVAAAGAVGLRGGAYKPRTSPYSFQGLREEGLKILREARERTGLAIVTEAIGLEEIAPVAEAADVVQIGARNMQHYPLLEAAGGCGKPVLLKRGPSAKLEEWLLAAEYVINAGNTQVILCERGIRTFEEYVRFTLPLSAVPELRERTHLPVLVDPSHGTGHAHLVPAMCRAAIAAGADGLLLEVHPDPEHALSDGAQSLTPAALTEMMSTLKRIANAVGREM
ncbi:MAG: 3-deoxy-7-phosphoheptulonate synthase [Phycisphaerae bacterium SM23_33]|nr:MAG: 3-deoxy-7-phosphoheptulonate synthase [Phycisphaerae bacterium SM23_33]